MYQELFNLIEYHLLNDIPPSPFFQTLKLKEEPFIILEKLKTTKQSPIYHPEGSVWNHTMLVIDEASNVKNQSSDSKVFMWAALLHDIGKTKTTKKKNNKITSYNHDTVGAKLVEEFFNYFNEEKTFIEKVSNLVLWHMQILAIANNNYSEKTLKKIKEDVNIDDLILLSTCDRLGRTNIDINKEKEKINLFVNKLKSL